MEPTTTISLIPPCHKQEHTHSSPTWKNIFWDKAPFEQTSRTVKVQYEGNARIEARFYREGCNVPFSNQKRAEKWLRAKIEVSPYAGDLLDERSLCVNEHHVCWCGYEHIRSKTPICFRGPKKLLDQRVISPFVADRRCPRCKRFLKVEYIKVA